MEDAASEKVLREYALLAPYYDEVWRRYIRTTVARTLGYLELTGNERVLDIGCGTGLLLATLARRFPALELHGLDLTSQMLNRAERRLAGAATLRRGTATQLPYPDDYFDVVVSTSVLHCIPPPLSPVIGEWLRVLRPHGRFAITDWRRDHLGTRAHVLALRAIGRRHHRPRTANELKGLFEANGARVEAIDSFRAGTWGLLTVSGVRR